MGVQEFRGHNTKPAPAASRLSVTSPELTGLQYWTISVIAKREGNSSMETCSFVMAGILECADPSDARLSRRSASVEP